jgi:hypothetical protein
MDAALDNILTPNRALPFPIERSTAVKRSSRRVARDRNAECQLFKSKREFVACLQQRVRPNDRSIVHEIVTAVLETAMRFDTQDVRVRGGEPNEGFQPARLARVRSTQDRETVQLLGGPVASERD